MRDLCSPIKRCFPPQPDLCAICRSTSTEGCIFRELEVDEPLVWEGDQA